MENKKYSSFEQIDKELEILKIERELNFQKIIYKIEKTKDLLTFKNIKNTLLESFNLVLKGYSGKIMEWGIPLFIKLLKKKIRGR